MAVFSHRLPYLDSEPRTVGIAPPPYRSCHDNDSTSGRYSDSSTTSSSLKRRASWTNFVEADENLNKFKVNVYPKISSQSTTASVVSSQMANPLPNKVPLSTRNPVPAGSVHGSSLSMSQSFYGGPNPSQVNYHAQIPSRQNSYNSASNSMVSEFFVMPPGSYQKLNYASPMPAGATPIPLDNPRGLSTTSSRPKKNKMEDLRQCWKKPAIKLICALLMLLVIIVIVLAIVLPLALIYPNHYQFSWQAPEMLRNRQTGSNNIELDIKDEQARFNLRGAVPFHSNFLSVYDFKSNKVAVVDSALQTNGKTAICFLMDLNRQNLKDLNTLKRAAKNAVNKNNQTQGWQEAWNFVPSPITNFQATSVFKPDIQECRNARWVELTYVNSNQKPTKCSDCYDFCLPDYGVERDVIRNEEYLNIVRRNCFYMFVPEWKNYAQAYPAVQQQGYQITQTGTQQNLPYSQQTGNFALPGYSNQPGMQPLPINQFGNTQQGNMQPQGLPQNQAGFANNQQMQIPGSQNYNQQQFGGTGGGGSGSGVGMNQNPQESRWISLANVPQQIVNRTGEVFNQGRQQVTQWGQQIGQNLGILPNQQQTFTPSSNQDNNANGIYQHHNLNGFDYQQRPFVQPPTQTANLNGFAGQNVGMGPSYNVQQGQGNSERNNAASASGNGQTSVGGDGGGVRTQRTSQSTAFDDMYFFQPQNPYFPHILMPRNTYSQNPPDSQFYPTGWNDNYNHAMYSRLMNSFFAHPNLPSPFPAPYNGPQSPQQRPVLPSQIFNPPTVQQQNERIAQQTNQNVLPNNPSDYFRQQQNMQQQYHQLTPQQQMQLTNQQSLGMDLSATIPPGQNDVNRDLQFLQNWGR